jgi:hypothetical protein
MKRVKASIIVAALSVLSATQASAQMFGATGVFHSSQFGNHVTIGRPASAAGQVAGAFGFNHENQVAVECVSQYGVTYAGAGCVTARLTADELNKCFTHGFGGHGCFGDNNTLVSMIRSNMEGARRETGTVNQVIRAGTGVSVRDMEEHGIFGGSNSVFNCPFGGC